jgi:hypothetical protein
MKVVKKLDLSWKLLEDTLLNADGKEPEELCLICHFLQKMLLKIGNLLEILAKMLNIPKPSMMDYQELWKMLKELKIKNL